MVRICKTFHQNTVNEQIALYNVNVRMRKGIL